MKKAVESLMVANEEKVSDPGYDSMLYSHLVQRLALNLLCCQSTLSTIPLPPLHSQDRKIDELKQSLLRYKKVQEMVMSVQGKKG